MQSKQRMILIDFDGTVVEHKFPLVGEEIGAVPVLKELVENGHKLILFTMRSDSHPNPTKTEAEPEISIHKGNFLQDAVNWFKSHDIPLYGIQANPTQHLWTTSPKAYGHLIIDDTSINCPLIYPAIGNPYVDWEAIRHILIGTGYINL